MKELKSSELENPLNSSVMRIGCLVGTNSDWWERFV